MVEDAGKIFTKLLIDPARVNVDFPQPRVSPDRANNNRSLVFSIHQIEQLVQRLTKSFWCKRKVFQYYDTRSYSNVAFDQNFAPSAFDVGHRASGVHGNWQSIGDAIPAHGRELNKIDA